MIERVSPYVALVTDGRKQRGQHGGVLCHVRDAARECCDRTIAGTRQETRHLDVGIRPSLGAAIGLEEYLVVENHARVGRVRPEMVGGLTARLRKRRHVAGRAELQLAAGKRHIRIRRRAMRDAETERWIRESVDEYADTRMLTHFRKCPFHRAQRAAVL